MRKNHSKISIVIATKNRPRSVIMCIESILIQTLLPDEIVVVDSSDSTELKSRLNALPHDRITFKYIHARTGLTQARNMGVGKSAGGIVIFLDDDVTLDKDYIKEITRVFNNDIEKKIGGVTGDIAFKHSIRNYIAQVLGSIFFLFKYGDGKFQPSGRPTFARSDKITNVECLSGSNMAFRKEIFNEFKFDENLHGYCSMEDVDFSYRVSRKYQNVYTPFAKLIHNVSPPTRDIEYARMKMEIENHYYLFKKNFPQTFKRRFAFWWSVVGLFAIVCYMAILRRSTEGLRGLKDGIITIMKKHEV